jgi:hypothetical protein
MEKSSSSPLNLKFLACISFEIWIGSFLTAPAPRRAPNRYPYSTMDVSEAFVSPHNFEIPNGQENNTQIQEL